MAKKKNELLARDQKRDIGKELLQAIREVKKGRYGAKYEVTASTPKAPQSR